MHARRHGHAPGHPSGTRMRSPGTGMKRTVVRARVRTSRARAEAVASTRQVMLGHQPVPQQNNTKGSRTPAPLTLMGSPPAADTRLDVLQQTRAVRGAGAALPHCLGPRSVYLHWASQVELAQNLDEKGGAAARPSTHTMVLCTGTRGSRVRSPPRQGRPGRAARAAARRTRSLPDSLPGFFPIFGRALSREISPKKMLTICPQ